MIILFESFVFSNFVETWSVEKFAKSQFTLWDFRIVCFRKLFKNLFELKLDLLYFHEKMRSDRTASSANPHPHLNQNFRSLYYFMLGIDYFGRLHEPQESLHHQQYPGPLYRSSINWKTREITISSLRLFESCIESKVEVVMRSDRIIRNPDPHLNQNFWSPRDSVICYLMLGFDHLGRSHEPHESRDHLQYLGPLHISLNALNIDTFIIDSTKTSEIIIWGFEARPKETLRKTYGIFFLHHAWLQAL